MDMEHGKNKQEKTNRKVVRFALTAAAAAMIGALLFTVCFASDEGMDEDSERMASAVVETEVSAGQEEEQGEGSAEEGGAERAVPVHIWGVVTGTDGTSITVDNQSEASSPGEIVLMVSPSAYVLDGTSGLPVALDEVNTGSFHAYLGPAMTMSLPPQAVPYAVIVNIPEDAAAPVYLVAAGEINESGDERILTATDGTEYRLAEEAKIQPFLTKNIVRMEEIREGSECLLWLDENGAVERVVLLNK